MKREPRVSVIIPTFNRARYLPAAISSVLGQTFRDFELIVVDDGSTDDTRSVVNNYTEHPQSVVHYIYQDHKNASVARNTGITKSRGEYIAFLDSDDVWLESKLEKQVQALDQMTVALVHTSRQILDSSSGRRSQLLPVPKIYARSSQHLLEGNSFIAMTVLVRATALQDVGGFDETLSTTQDMELWLRIASRFEIAFLDEPLMISRKLEDGLSYSNLKRKYTDRIEVLKRMLSHTHPFVNKSIWMQRLIQDSQALEAEKNRKP